MVKFSNAVDAKKWTNVLAVVELLFSLPVSKIGACFHS